MNSNYWPIEQMSKILFTIYKFMWSLKVNKFVSTFIIRAIITMYLYKKKHLWMKARFNGKAFSVSLSFFYIFIIHFSLLESLLAPNQFAIFIFTVTNKNVITIFFPQFARLLFASAHFVQCFSGCVDLIKGWLLFKIRSRLVGVR